MALINVVKFLMAADIFKASWNEMKYAFQLKMIAVGIFWNEWTNTGVSWATVYPLNSTKRELKVYRH